MGGKHYTRNFKLFFLVLDAVTLPHLISSYFFFNVLPVYLPVVMEILLKFAKHCTVTRQLSRTPVYIARKFTDKFHLIKTTTMEMSEDFLLQQVRDH